MSRLLHTEPVRTALYGLLAAVLAALVGAGVIDTGQAAVITGLITAAVVLATEVARSQVSPVRPVPDLEV